MRIQHIRSSALVAGLMAATVLTTGTHAFAERRNPLDGQPAIRYRKEMRRLRLEITPSFSVSLNQDYKHAVGGGGTIAFHVLDWLGIGVEGSGFANTHTALESAVRSAVETEASGTNGVGGRYPNGYVTPGPNPTLAQHDARILGIKAAFSPFVQVTPFSGKFALFSSAFAWYDLYAKGGVGIVDYTQNYAQNKAKDLSIGSQNAKTCVGASCDPNLQDSSIYAGVKVGGMIGVGVHLYFTDWIGLQLELRDYIVKANPGGGDTNGDRRLTSSDAGTQNNIFFTAGLTFMIPGHARITR